MSNADDEDFGSPPDLLLRVLEGPHRGTRVPVREGLMIGRKEGDLLIRDVKMSIRHVQIELKNGEWVMVDQGSSNKIKADGKRYSEVVLYAGLKMVIGSTPFEVLERPQVARQAPGEFEFTGSIEVTAEGLSWKDILTGVLAKTDHLVTDPTRKPIKPFPTVVKMEFTSGPQHGTTWHIGYGPREIGAHSFDLSLIDEAAAETCFHLDTAGGKVLFRAALGAQVRLNGDPAPVAPVELRAGDRIEIGKTRIRVSLG